MVGYLLNPTRAPKCYLCGPSWPFWIASTYHWGSPWKSGLEKDIYLIINLSRVNSTLFVLNHSSYPPKPSDLRFYNWSVSGPLSTPWFVFTDLTCSPPGSSVHGISQARILEWVTMLSSRGSSWPRDQTCVSCIGRQILYHWANWEAHTDLRFQQLWILESPESRGKKEGWNSPWPTRREVFSMHTNELHSWTRLSWTRGPEGALRVSPGPVSIAKYLNPGQWTGTVAWEPTLTSPCPWFPILPAGDAET